MSGSKAQCSISDRGAAPALVMDDLIEDDGFITVMASGWTPPHLRHRANPPAQTSEEPDLLPDPS